MARILREPNLYDDLRMSLFVHYGGGLVASEKAKRCCFGGSSVSALGQNFKLRQITSFTHEVEMLARKTYGVSFQPLEREMEEFMAKVGDRFYTGQKCDTSGSYVFDGYYPNGETTPAPTQDERVESMREGGTFPPIRSQSKSAYWKLQRIS